MDENDLPEDPNENNLPEDPIKRPAFVVLIITTVLFGAVFVPSIVVAFLTTMIFDRHTNQEVLIWVLALSVFTFPLMCLISVASSWIAYVLKSYIAAIILSLLPTINMITFLIASQFYK